MRAAPRDGPNGRPSAQQRSRGTTPIESTHSVPRRGRDVSSLLASATVVDIRRKSLRCSSFSCESAVCVLAAAVALGLAGCKVHAPAAQKQSEAQEQTTATADAGAAKSYIVRGKVVSTNAATGEVTLDAEEIKGFMDAMTMPYKLKKPETLSELHPGDKITGRLQVGGGADPGLDQVVVVAQARPDYVPATQYHVPAVGDRVPDFKLLDQDGKEISLAQFKGKVLLITFIYTRCPLSDYCPRMSRNFAEIDHALSADAALKARTHLLSISFDPVYDKPAVLRSYGGAYTGLYTNEKFEHWTFAAPSKSELPAMTSFFDVGVMPGDKGTLTHTLSTVVVGADGNVLAWYPTNDWKPAEVVDLVKKAAI